MLSTRIDPNYLDYNEERQLSSVLNAHFFAILDTKYPVIQYVSESLL